MEKIFEGVATALYTPFTNDGIDFNHFDFLIDYQLKSKIDALVFLGTTGESPTVTRTERTEIIKFAVSRCNGKIPVIIGTGSNDTKTAIELTKEAYELGADCALIVTPYYNRCEQEGLFLHYKEICSNVNLPIILYNVPKRTGVNIETNTIEKLLKIKNIVGLKEANSDKKHVDKIFENFKYNLNIYCGNDHLNFYFLNCGAHGTISVASNVIPLKIKEFISNFKMFYYNKARSVNDELIPFYEALQSMINPIPVKAFAEIIFGRKQIFRLPLNRPNDNYFEYLKTILTKLKYDELGG